ncbi:unnamed protein product [Penicillium egyptiacum]|uniref:Uncharacterized protein n=1 Tax=Penicillium egyptiacum TaxID=1303716 RepID=A0A9W4NZC3_9EURO|nr:unnamed protein product [Penicillium egyptiacum]
MLTIFIFQSNYPMSRDIDGADKLPTEGVFSSNSVTLSLAYITFDKIQSLRRKHVYTPSYKIVNTPVLRVRQKRLDSLVPQNLAEDPYIVTILIALAQEQRRRQQEQQQGSPGQGAKVITKYQASHMDADTTLSVAKSSTARSSCPSTEQMNRSTANSFKVQVLAVPGIAADAFYVYTADIPSGFLNKFDEPSHYSPSPPVAITYCRVPLASSNMLRKLHRLLCATSCSFCCSNKEQDFRAAC